MDNLMVRIVGIVRSEWNKLPIFMSYKPYLETSGITSKAKPSLLIPKVLVVFSIKIASKQPLSKVRWIVQSLSIIWHF